MGPRSFLWPFYYPLMETVWEGKERTRRWQMTRTRKGGDTRITRTQVKYRSYNNNILICNIFESTNEIWLT